MGSYTKTEAIKIIVSCAEKYKSELEGRTLLFVCCNKHRKVFCYEFTFNDSNFRHLTGVKRLARENKFADEEEISAKDFYSRCINHKLSPSDFEFDPEGTTFLKLDILPSIINKNLSAKMIGDYNSSKPKLETDKLAGGITACIGFKLDDNGTDFVPNTVLKEDIRNITNEQLRVIAAYRKWQTESLYSELTYKCNDKKLDWSKLKYPDEYTYLHPMSQR